MDTPDFLPPNIDDYYYGGAVSGWNAGIWDERIPNVPIPFSHLHNFAPILIHDASTNLNFSLCGNGYFYGPPQDAVLYAEVIIANCSQFYNVSGASASSIAYTRVLNDQSASIGQEGTVCFDFTATYSVDAPCEYHAAVALVVVSDQVGTSKLDFSYQLRVSQQ
jgi:hypothetical protein